MPKYANRGISNTGEVFATQYIIRGVGGAAPGLCAPNLVSALYICTNICPGWPPFFNIKLQFRGIQTQRLLTTGKEFWPLNYPILNSRKSKGFLSKKHVKNLKYRFLHVLGRVADPVHFWPNPDPATQNFKHRIRIPILILLLLTKNQFKHLSFFHINQISSDIFMLIFSTWKKEKFTWKCVNAQCCPSLYNFI